MNSPGVIFDLVFFMGWRGAGWPPWKRREFLVDLESWNGHIGFMGAKSARKGCLVILFLTIASLVSFGCGSSQDASSARRVTFDIVDSLLGQEYQIVGAGKSFCPPLGFLPVPDTVLAGMRVRLQESLGPRGGVELAQIFFDSAAQAGVMVSIMHGVTLTSDTGAFFARYRQSLHEMYRDDQVKEGEYWVEDVFVKNYLITDTNTVRFQLICCSDKDAAVELTYFAPSNQYPDLIKHFESSIGTIRLTQKGG
jgi:hypothetical protein